MHLCFSIKIKSAAYNNNDIAAGIITVNNLFEHWITEIDIKRYGDDIPILPLTNTVDIYITFETYAKKCIKNI